jgi:hypothetical protein
MLCAMYGWERRSLESLKDSLPSVPDVLQLGQLLPKLLHTVHYKNSSCIPVTFSLRRRYCHTITCVLSKDSAAVGTNTVFAVKVLFKDISYCIRTGFTNIHNEHVWSDENSCDLVSPSATTVFINLG